MVSLGTGDKHRIFIYTDQQKVRRASYASFRLPLRLALSRWPCHMEALHNCWCPSQEEPIFLSAIPVKGARDPHILMPKESELVCVCVCVCVCVYVYVYVYVRACVCAHPLFEEPLRFITHECIWRLWNIGKCGDPVHVHTYARMHARHVCRQECTCIFESCDISLKIHPPHKWLV